MSQPIHFGSLEEQERQRILQEQQNNDDNQSITSKSTAITFQAPPPLRPQNPQPQQQQQTLDFDQLLPPPSSMRNALNKNDNKKDQESGDNNSNQNQGNSNVELLELSEEAQRAKEKQLEALKSLKLKQALAKIQIPTLDKEVKLRLRELQQPIHLFGEESIDRRERLRQECANYMVAHGEMPKFENLESISKEDEDLQHFRYVGPSILKEIRTNIVQHSLKSAALRIEKQKLKQAAQDPLEQEDEIIKENYEASKFQIFRSQFGDTSAISKGSFSPDGQFFGTAGGSGTCKLWKVPDCDLQSTLNGHLSKVHEICFHPQATLGLDEGSYANIATCSSDQNIRLWTLRQDQEYQKSIIFKGHGDRVNKVVYHPTGDYLYSTSHDNTWKFWDIQTQQAVITQTGHASHLYAMSMHPDGSLLYTGDFCGQGVIWDLRTGKNILNLQGHVKYILASDFHSNGYQLATAGDDNTIRFWDLRRKNCAKIVPGHLKLISDIKYQPEKANYLTSVSYDNSVKVWNTQTFDLTQALTSHEAKVTGVSFSPDSEYMATTTLDRKFMFWKKTFFDL